MAYKKKTLKDFKNDLDAKTYESVAGARRAVGKFADWGDADRKSAHRMIDAYFGGTPKHQTPTERKPRPVKAKKGSKKTAPAAAAPAAPPPAAAAPAKAPKAAKVKKTGGAAARPDKPAHAAKSKENRSSVALAEAYNTLGTYEAALQNLETIKRIDSGFNVSAGLSEAHDGIRECLMRLRGLGAAAPAVAVPPVPAPAPPATPAASPGLGFTPAMGGMPGFAHPPSQG